MASHDKPATRSREGMAPMVVAVLAIALFDAGAMLYGRAAQSAAHLASLQQRLPRLPVVFTGWQGRPTNEEVPTALPGTVATGYVFHRDDTQETVRVYLLAGPWRSLAGHQPGDLFTESGFRALGPPTVIQTDPATWLAPLATANFVKEQPAFSQRYEVWWSYCGSAEGWSLPTWLGGFNASQPVVKVYLIREGGDSQTVASSPVAELGALLLPAWAAALFSPKESTP